MAVGGPNAAAAVTTLSGQKKSALAMVVRISKRAKELFTVTLPGIFRPFRGNERADPKGKIQAQPPFYVLMYALPVKGQPFEIETGGTEHWPPELQKTLKEQLLGVKVTFHAGTALAEVSWVTRTILGQSGYLVCCRMLLAT